MNLAIASDHAGFPIKKAVGEYLKIKGHSVFDFGTYSEDSTDYTIYAHKLAKAIEAGEYELGIAVCGSGNGINITLNKHQGIRSALCWNKEISELARAHNNANVCALPGRFLTEQEAFEIVQTFIETAFLGGRHETRINNMPVT
jgi:ribose 5-phosphate isomerase B